MKKSHIHKYERIVVGKRGYTVYKCMMPDCPHHVQIELSLGRSSQCWGCGTTITITKYHVIYRIKKPLCEDCAEARQEAREKMIQMKAQGND